MKILVVLSRLPFPLDKGDKLRAYNQIKRLSERHEIILIALNDRTPEPEAITELKKFCRQVHVHQLHKPGILVNMQRAFLKNMPLQVGYFLNPKARKELDLIISQEQPDILYCQLLRTAEYIRYRKDIPKAIDYMDVFSKGVERRKEEAPFYLKPVFNYESQKLQQYETSIFDDFQVKTIISEEDRNYINHPDKAEIEVIPNGVDTDFFHPMEKPKTCDLVFTGNMSYPPNVSAAVFLVEKIMPLVWQKNPEVNVMLAGIDPAAKVTALQSDKVKVSGWLEDIRDAYACARVFIAPMQIGTGLQNKLLEAMAMKLPCITSGLANKALKANECRHLLIGETPEQYAAHIQTLLSDENFAAKMAEEGHLFVKARYNWDATTARLEELLLDAVGKTTSAQAAS